MKWNVAGVTVTAVLMLASCLAAGTAPQPDEFPTAWQLDFEYQRPKAVQVRLPGETEKRVYWVMIYTVTNKTGDDQIFVPDFALYTDTGQILRAGTDVPNRVFEHVKRTYNKPLLKDMTEISGRILQGADNARTGAAIWPDFDAKAGSFDVFIGGLSGESAEVELPTPVTVMEMDPLTGEKEEVVRSRILLSRTLRIRYSVPGEAAGRLRAPVEAVTAEWVMR